MSNGTLTPRSDRRITSGPDHAPVTLVEYGDYRVPALRPGASRRAGAPARARRALRFVFRNFPLREAHPHAEHAAEAAEAVGARRRRAFWEMHDMTVREPGSARRRRPSRLRRKPSASIGPPWRQIWRRAPSPRVCIGISAAAYERRQRHPDVLRQRPALRRQLDGRRELCRRPAGAGPDTGIALIAQRRMSVRTLPSTSFISRPRRRAAVGAISTLATVGRVTPGLIPRPEAMNNDCRSGSVDT